MIDGDNVHKSLLSMTALENHFIAVIRTNLLRDSRDFLWRGVNGLYRCAVGIETSTKLCTHSGVEIHFGGGGCSRRFDHFK